MTKPDGYCHNFALDDVKARERGYMGKLAGFAGSLEMLRNFHQEPVVAIDDEQHARALGAMARAVLDSPASEPLVAGAYEVMGPSLLRYLRRIQGHDA